jgi:predicted ATPase
MLNLTHTVVAEQIDDTRVEIRVGRLPVGTNPALNDLVSIADVGFGVSQTLPVLVALLVAKPGQLVYIEQPEVHLHPRAQIAMAEILANAAKRGIRIVAETHSALLLRGIQTVVANGGIISTEDVILHWFERDIVDGITKIRSADLDKAGSFGDWPVDFGEVLMKAESDYIQAAEPHLRMD